MKRRDFLKSATAAAAGSVLPAAPAVWSPAKAQSRQETLLIVSESGPNNIDIHGIGTNVPGYETSWNCYDRLITHEMKTGENGAPYYDRDKFKPELAEDMNVGDMSVTFKLKKNATFHDGTPVTAKDVKWSLDRAVTVGGFPTFQMKAGSLEKPEQFVVVDDHTVRVDFLRKDRLTVPDLAVIVPCVVNSELVKKNATDKDPWGLEYTKQNTAGSGAYRVAKWTAGTEVIYERNDKWAGGPLPKVKRVIWRMVPSAGNRRALLERGDADISYDLPNKDFAELKNVGKLSIVSTPYSNGIQYIGMNVKTPPFDNLKVREAIACALPYQKIMDAVMFGLAKPMFGAPADAATTDAWPQPHKYVTDIAKAKQLLAEAGYPNGFSVPLYAYRDRRYSEAVVGYLRKIGITADLRFLQWTALRPIVQQDGKAEMAQLTWGSQGILDASASVGNYFEGSPDDYARDAEVEAWLKAADSTVDASQRKALYGKALKKIADQAYFVPIFLYGRPYVFNSELDYPVTPDELAHFYMAKWK